MTTPKNATRRRVVTVAAMAVAEADRRVVRRVDQRREDEALDDDGAGVLLVELGEAEVVAGDGRVDDVPRPGERSDRGNRPAGGDDATPPEANSSIPSDIQRVFDGGEAEAGHRAVDGPVDDGVEAVVRVGVQPDREELDGLFDRPDDKEKEKHLSEKRH